MIGAGVWGLFVTGFLTLFGTLALVEVCALFLRLGPRAAAGESVE